MNVPVAKGKTWYKYDSPVHSPVQSGPLTSRLSWTTRCTGRSCTSFPHGGCRSSQKTPCSPDTPSGRSRPTLRHCVRVGAKQVQGTNIGGRVLKWGLISTDAVAVRSRANLEFASAPSLPGAAFIFGDTSRFRQRKRALPQTQESRFGEKQGGGRQSSRFVDLRSVELDPCGGGNGGEPVGDVHEAVVLRASSRFGDVALRVDESRHLEQTHTTYGTQHTQK